MNSDMLLYATAELAVLLLCICAFLVFHVGNLKKLIKRLEAKVLELRGTITATKHNARAKIQEVKNNFQEKTYLEYIDEQIELTREHHAGQSPDRDIVLDLDTAEGQEAARKLILTADAVLEDQQVGYLAARGLGYADVSALKPSLVSFQGWPDDARVRVGALEKTVRESQATPFRITTPPQGNNEMRHRVAYTVSVGGAAESGEKYVVPGKPLVIVRGAP